MTTVGEILAYLETQAPSAMKMDWDNVGLLCGSRSQAVRKVLVALDPFEGVCREAEQWGADFDRYPPSVDFFSTQSSDG